MPPAPVKLTPNSYLSFSILGMIVAATLWIRDGQARALNAANEVSGELTHYKELQKISNELIVTKIDGIRILYEQSALDRWTGHDHKVFAERMQELNPNLHVPK